jgi:hypothetical protein
MADGIERFLPNDEYLAATGAASPSAGNPFATIADVGGNNLANLDQVLAAPRTVTLTEINTLLFSGGTTTIRGAGTTTAYSLKVEDFNGIETFGVRDDGRVSARRGYSINNTLFAHTTIDGDQGATLGRNTFVGFNTPSGLTGVGQNNSGFGWNSLGSLTTGPRNAAFGVSSGALITTGPNNAFFGYSAASLLAGNQEHNAIFGYNGLPSATAAQYCTTAGAGAGKNVTTGTGLTLLGADTGAEVAGSYSSAVAVGRDATITANAQFVLGADGAGIIDSLYLGMGVHQDSLPGNGITMQPTSIKAGNTDVSSANYLFKIAGSQSTGNQPAGNIVLQTAAAGVAGSAQNPLVDRLVVRSDGDTEFVGIGFGFILTSPNGSRYKYTADNTGALVFTGPL